MWRYCHAGHTRKTLKGGLCTWRGMGMNCVVTEKSVSWKKLREATEYMLHHSAVLAAGWDQANPTPILVPHWNKQ